MSLSFGLQQKKNIVKNHVENEEDKTSAGVRKTNTTENLSISIWDCLDLPPLDLDLPFLDSRPTELADTKADGWIFILERSTPLPSLSEQWASLS